ncbi:uncharacterized protein BJ212DRAFT_1303887 [Suillus subaureus]|uniref:Uncharacterized protein n=1 Tax=Suillus subaureus TaxID=48587 RepID=A0A9P7DXW8_9AGAM|nr:uncharacterized protein BJ212DRAFT_1303887 [Suillus subaureus]KAG1805820.1 hypothetical protein BJ212DRAFT_1303887 [Suillus subaureus]
MPHPIIHKTLEAKLAAAREEHSCYYARNRDRILKNWRELCSSNSKESRAARKFSRDISKAVEKALCCGDKDESESDTGSKESDSQDSDDDKNSLNFKMKLNISNRYDLPECLCIIKEIKDEMLVKINNSCNFAHGILCAYVKNTVSCFLRTVLVYLEDIQYLALYGGAPDLTLAHSMGELMYQKGIKV